MVSRTFLLFFLIFVLQGLYLWKWEVLYQIFTSTMLSYLSILYIVIERNEIILQQIVNNIYLLIVNYVLSIFHETYVDVYVDI